MKTIIDRIESFINGNIPKSRGKESYLKHVFGARKYALKLADLYNADKFVLEVASLLHDVGADSGVDTHAKVSADISKVLLTKLGLSKRLINMIVKCIGAHPMGQEVSSIEQRILQDADGIIFLEDTYKSFYEKRKQKYSRRKARELGINKVKGMMNKIKTEEGIRIAKNLLNKALEYIKNY